MQNETSLGRMVSTHRISGAAVQKVAVVAALSFTFFLGTLVAFYASGRTVFFLLSGGFLAIYVFTMIGWFTLKKTELRLLDGGLTYRKASVSWDVIEALERIPGRGLRINVVDGPAILVAESISDLDEIEAFIRSRKARTA